MPSARAILRSAPTSGSVIKTRCCRAASSPTAPARASRTMRYCAIVSTVPPDFEITSTSVRANASRSSVAAMVAGSTLSSTCSRGAPPRAAVLRVFHAGGRNAVRNAIGPRAEPPIPSSSTSSKRPRACSATASVASRNASFTGNVRKPSSACMACTRACAMAKAPDASESCSAVMPAPCGSAAPIMFVKSSDNDMQDTPDSA